MPNASARGGNAFSAMRTAPPIPLNHDSDDIPGNPTVPTAVGEISTNDSHGAGNTFIDLMDIDQHESDTTSNLTSNSFGKRKLDVIASDEELDIYKNPTPLSKPPSRAPTKSETPAKKKTFTGKSLPRSTSSTHSSQQRRATLASTSTKMTPALIAHEIQGSINSLASAVRESGQNDPVANNRQDAIRHVLDDSDGGLSDDEKLAIIDLFRKEYAAVQTYLALISPGYNDLRLGWLEKQLRELKVTV